jgi:hypothetical protein
MAGGIVFYPKCRNFFGKLGNPLLGIFSVLGKGSFVIFNFPEKTLKRFPNL